MIRPPSCAAAHDEADSNSSHHPRFVRRGSLHTSGPRERLAAHGAALLSEAELLALLLRTGSRGRSALATATALLDAVGGLRELSEAPRRTLESVAGVGPAKACVLVAAFEIARRVDAEPLLPGASIHGPESVDRHFRSRLRGDRQESFRILLLDGRHRFMSEVLVTRGTLTASLVHPREVFRPALREAAAALVLVHNHPSGDPSPSAEDREVTRRLERAGELLGVRVLDHVILAERGFYSFREAGALASEGTGKRDAVPASRGLSGG